MTATQPARTPVAGRPPLPFWLVEPHVVAHGWPPLWWVGCHGGAGASALALLTELGVDAGGAWPQAPESAPTLPVVLVCRASASGVAAASAAVEQYRSRRVPANTALLGVVAVAASARKPPRIVAERLQLLRGWAPAVWQVGWVEEYLAADDPRDVGVPPDLVALRHHLARGTHIEEGRR